MKTIIHYIVTGSVSFTFSSLFYLFFSELGIFPNMSNQMMLNVLYITIAILVLIYATNLLPIENSITIYALELLSVITVLISSSFFFALYPFDIQYLLPILLIGVMTYIIVIVVFFIGNQTSAKRINSLIKKRNEVQKDD